MGFLCPGSVPASRRAVRVKDDRTAPWVRACRPRSAVMDGRPLISLSRKREADTTTRDDAFYLPHSPSRPELVEGRPPDPSVLRQAQHDVGGLDKVTAIELQSWF